MPRHRFLHPGAFCPTVRMMKNIELNDAIHRTITLSQREQTVLDHPYVQRLRHIRQLGFVPLVFPSATHDRFSHSLGTLHVVSLMVRQLLLNDEYSVLARTLSEEEKTFVTRIVRLAALLHDIGHAPFSHTAEKVMPAVSNLDIPLEWLRFPHENRPARHEDYSVLLLSGMSQGEGAVLGDDEPEIVASLIHHKKIKTPVSWMRHFSARVNAPSLHRVARSLISSDLDADRMDYLLRDAHFAGVAYGQFDLPWLISNLGVVYEGDEYVMSISDTGIHALEHYLFARYNMYTQVYMHKTVKCFDYYFQRALDEGELAYAIPAARDRYAALRDATLIEALFDAAGRRAHSWAGRLVRRDPAKRIARIWGNGKEVPRIFEKMSQELAHYRIIPFLHFSKSKFLDFEEAADGGIRRSTDDTLFQGLATVPFVVVRKHFGTVSIASLADYAFLLKRYHDDVGVTDIYVLRDEYRAHERTILEIVRKYRNLSPSERIIGEEL